MRYVDPLRQWTGDYPGSDAVQAKRTGARNGHRWCHLFSDETDPAYHDLVAFGLSLGLRREWFQGDHWDLTPRRREAAVRRGAIECTEAEAIAIWRRTPRARRWRCRQCRHVTERLTQPPIPCPSCGAKGGAP